MEIVLTWASIVEDEEKAKAYKQARGKGGHVRANWKDVTDIIVHKFFIQLKRMVQIESQDLHQFLPCQ